MKLTLDARGAPPVKDYSIPEFKIRATQYYSDNGAGVGYSWVDGRQYSIATPKAAEVLHTAAGEVTYVDADGGLHTLRAGDVLFIAPDKPYTARDGKNYTHQYVVFPLALPKDSKLAQMQNLRPSELKATDFESGPLVGTHVYFKGDRGVTVFAWRPAATGSVDSATENEYIAITAGSGQIVEGKATTSFSAGDTLLVRKGASYTWSGNRVEAVCVKF